MMGTRDVIFRCKKCGAQIKVDHDSWQRRITSRSSAEEHECELCGQPATHFCECDRCRSASTEDGEGIPRLDEEDTGRWLCDNDAL